MWVPENLTRSQIERRSREWVIDPLIWQVGQNHLIRNGLKFDELYERVIKPRFKVALEEGVDLSSISALGVYEPWSNLVRIDSKLAACLGDSRRVFTLYHEVCGHAVLQGRWLRAQLVMCKGQTPLVDDASTLDIRAKVLLERQANMMAGLCAAPMWLVNAQIIYRLEPSGLLRYRGPGRYCFGRRGAKRWFEVTSATDYCRGLAAMIAPWFHGLSVEALGYRVQRSELVAGVRVRTAALRRAA
jgi:hypothetical protein